MTNLNPQKIFYYTASISIVIFTTLFIFIAIKLTRLINNLKHFINNLAVFKDFNKLKRDIKAKILDYLINLLKKDKEQK